MNHPETARFLLQEESAWPEYLLNITPPEGGKVRLVDVQMDETEPWRHLLQSAGQPAQQELWNLGDKVPDLMRRPVHHVALVTFGRFRGSGQVLRWGVKWNLSEPFNPRLCMYLAGRPAELSDILEAQKLGLVSLRVCDKDINRQDRVCGVWWEKPMAERVVKLDLYDGGWQDYCWFGFEWVAPQRKETVSNVSALRMV